MDLLNLGGMACTFEYKRYRPMGGWLADQIGMRCLESSMTLRKHISPTQTTIGMHQQTARRLDPLRNREDLATDSSQPHLVDLAYRFTPHLLMFEQLRHLPDGFDTDTRLDHIAEHRGE